MSASACRHDGVRTDRNLSEVVLHTGETCPGIIDTGASKSVIGKNKVRALLNSLPASIRAQSYWRSSQTVFRFGNGQTLTSVGALYLPFGSQWMRLEVVDGRTPFLLSNAFLRALGADVSSSEQAVILPRLGLRIPLQRDAKGLYQVELADVLSRLGPDASPEKLEVVTMASHVGVDDVDVGSGIRVGCGHVHVAQSDQPCVEQPFRQCSPLLSDVEGNGKGSRGHGQGHEGASSEFVEGDLAPLSGGQSSHGAGAGSQDCEASGRDYSGGVGCVGPHGRQAPQQVLPTGLFARRDLPQVHGQQSQVEGAVGPELSELCSCSGGPGATADQREDGRAPETEGDLAARTESSDGPTRVKHVRCLDGMVGVPETVMVAVQQWHDLEHKVSLEMDSLLATSQQIRKQVSAMGGDSGSLDLLEVYCHERSCLTDKANSAGLKARRFTLADGDLGTEAGRARLWEIIETERPTHIWVAPECRYWGNFSRFNMGRGETSRAKILAGRARERDHLMLCNDLYLWQISVGRHFHMEQPQGSEAFEQKEVRNLVSGTLPTVFDMCEVGALRVPVGNNYLRMRTVVRTTSRELHHDLDARYCQGLHSHQPIKGQIKVNGRWHSVSDLAARYSRGFALGVVRALRRAPSSPLLVDELCASHVVGADLPEQRCLVGEVLKRRRLESKQDAHLYVPPVPGAGVPGAADPLPHKLPSRLALRTWFQDLDGLAPRVGPAPLDPSGPAFARAQHFCPHFRVLYVELCRGTDRYRVPRSGVDVSQLRFRMTMVLHRTTGEVVTVGGVQEWQKLPKTRRQDKAAPARLGVTLFGEPWDSAE